MSTLVQLTELAVRYRGAEAEALTPTSLALGRGERLAVIGESGSGKSTLALAIAGLLPPTAQVTGSIAWPGIGRLPANGSDIGFVFQDAGASLDPLMRVGDQIAEVAAVHRRLARRQALTLTEELLARVELPTPSRTRRAYPHQLSGGQRQRVAIAAAIAGQPSLLIADEPTSALDAIVQARIVALLQRLVAEERMALLFITHDLALAAGLAQRVAVLRAGRLVEIGPAAQVLSAPRAPYTRSLVAAQLALEGRLP
jgi:peptide/nickel transport system ATP-binding protein